MVVTWKADLTCRLPMVFLSKPQVSLLTTVRPCADGQPRLKPAVSLAAFLHGRGALVNSSDAFRVFCGMLALLQPLHAQVRWCRWCGGSHHSCCGEAALLWCWKIAAPAALLQACLAHGLLLRALLLACPGTCNLVRSPTGAHMCVQGRTLGRLRPSLLNLTSSGRLLPATSAGDPGEGPS